jgi:ribosomal protein S18 acetylase RimI-like enzyme
MQIQVEHGSCIGTIYYNGQATILVIDDVHVEEGYRRKGVGTELMKYVIEIAKENKVDCIELLVNSYNLVAKGLYKKAGFSKTSKEHYRLILRRF